MGDWNTLHFFDDHRFYDRVVPMLKGEASGLGEYFTKAVNGGFIYAPVSLTIDKVIQVSNEMENDFREYAPLLNIESNYPKVSEYLAANGWLEGYGQLVEFIIYSECASFYPYFRLGKNAFAHAVEYRNHSTISEELVDQLIYGLKGNPFDCFDFGIRGWLTADEVKLLGWAPDTIWSSEAPQYIEHFKIFVNHAALNNLGLLTGRNTVERFHHLYPGTMASQEDIGNHDVIWRK